MKISDRLRLMAQEVNKMGTVADIGSDHGYLALLVLSNNPESRIIVTDISIGSLDKAKENIGRALHSKMEKKAIDYRLGSGLEVLKEGEAEAAVIGGMGGSLIIKILEDSPKLARSLKKLVLQPRSSEGKLRHWLLENNYKISKEILAKEGNFISNILVVIPEFAKSNNEELLSLDTGCESGKGRLPWTEANEILYELPEALLKVEDKALLKIFLKGRLKREVKIKKILSEMDSADLVRVGITDNRITYIKELIKSIV